MTSLPCGPISPAQSHPSCPPALAASTAYGSAVLQHVSCRFPFDEEGRNGRWASDIRPGPDSYPWSTAPLAADRSAEVCPEAQK